MVDDFDILNTRELAGRRTSSMTRFVASSTAYTSRLLSCSAFIHSRSWSGRLNFAETYSSARLYSISVA